MKASDLPEGLLAQVARVAIHTMFNTWPTDKQTKCCEAAKDLADAFTKFADARGLGPVELGFCLSVATDTFLECVAKTGLDVYDKANAEASDGKTSQA